jgi:hypothetical protein
MPAQHGASPNRRASLNNATPESDTPVSKAIGVPGDGNSSAAWGSFQYLGAVFPGT